MARALAVPRAADRFHAQAAVDGHLRGARATVVPTHPATVVDCQRETATGSVNCHTRAGMLRRSVRRQPRRTYLGRCRCPGRFETRGHREPRRTPAPMQGRGMKPPGVSAHRPTTDDRHLARRRADSESVHSCTRRPHERRGHQGIAAPTGRSRRRARSRRRGRRARDSRRLDRESAMRFSPAFGWPRAGATGDRIARALQPADRAHPDRSLAARPGQADERGGATLESMTPVTRAFEMGGSAWRRRCARSRKSFQGPLTDRVRRRRRFP